jgi:Rrf2 family protein
MIEIAKSQSSKGVFQKDIAIAQSLSNKYLDHIIHSLKISGLIINVKGKKSGYLLARPPESITAFDIYKAFEPELCLVECLSPTHQCDRINYCEVQGFWKGLNIMITEYLRSVKLSDLMKNPEFESGLTESVQSKAISQ